MFRGEESSRLYALKRFVDVYPSISKPEGMLDLIKNYGLQF